MPEEKPSKTPEPRKLEIDNKPFDGADYEDTPPERDPKKEAEIQQMLAEAIEYANTHNLHGEETEPSVPQENTKEKKFTETVSENFKKFVDDYVTALLMDTLWTQTTRGWTNIPDEKGTEKFLEYTTNKAKEILFGKFNLNLIDVQRKYIMDELYKKLKEQNLTEPFRDSLKRFFEIVFHGLPTDFNADEK